MAADNTYETLTRADAAARLRAFADQIEGGVISGPGIQASVPEQLMLGLEIESGEVEMKLKWPATAPTTPAA